MGKPAFSLFWLCIWLCRAGRAKEAPMRNTDLQRANLDLLLQLDRLLTEADRARTRRP